MFRRALIPASLSLLAACSDGTPVEPVVVPPPPPSLTFLVFGFVETVDGIPLAGARVDLFGLGGEVLLSSEFTGANGYFAFSDIRGQVLLKVSMSGYFFQSRVVDVTYHVLARFQLLPWTEADYLTLGEWIQSRVLAGESPCDPFGWDASAPCHRFLFTPSASGKLVVTLEWSGDPGLDATLANSVGGYVGTSEPTGFERLLLEGPVVNGQSYELRVNSYYGAQDFRLKAELVP